MRITGGRARSIPLKHPGTIRPTTDALREAIFSSLGTLVRGAQVLDLFAGTGAYGLEAVSRGATTATFVEQCPLSLACLKNNALSTAKSLQEEPQKIFFAYSADVFSWQPPSDNPMYDLIFIDPPYCFYDISKRMDFLFKRITPWLKKSATSRLLIETPNSLQLEIPSQFMQIRHLTRGSKQSPSAHLLAQTHTHER